MSNPMTHKFSVLFLCTANSARSQMAEGILRHLAGDSFEVHSAGVEPREVHPLTHQVLGEMGIDSTAHYPKDVKEFLGRKRVHYAIVVCEGAQERCPAIYPFAHWVHFWPFVDPAAQSGSAEQQLAKFREVRDAIADRILDWLQGQGVAVPSSFARETTGAAQKPEE